MHPPNLAFSLRRARQFYKQFNALPLDEHCQGVYRRATKENVIDALLVNHPKDDAEACKLAWFHNLVAETTLYHVVDANKLLSRSVDLSFLREDHPLFNPDVCTELSVFTKLTELDRRGAPAQDYEHVLNNGHAPRALLTKLVDYAVTHDTEDRTPGHISHHHSPLFRMYTSKADAKRSLEMDAKAGERIYASLAELFGFPLLAGDILKHAYKFNHPAIYGHVLAMVEREHAEGRLAATQAISRKLIRVLEQTFANSGFDVSIVPRMEKHEGKIMRKFYKLLVDRHKILPPSYNPPLDEYIAQTIREYSFMSLNDAVALKVVLDRFKGVTVDTMPEAEKNKVIDIAVKLADVQLQILRMAEGYMYDHQFVDKNNGYKAHHFDARPKSDGTLLPVEVQVKTREWDDIATHGKAAHYYYIGGDPAFIDMVSKAYHEIIYQKQNGDNGR